MRFGNPFHQCWMPCIACRQQGLGDAFWQSIPSVLDAMHSVQTNRGWGMRFGIKEEELQSQHLLVKTGISDLGTQCRR